ncbi:ATP-binding cassette domain-containing protein [Pyrobaculum aerophilum]|uniref:ATP-binding cassette domain-containing protein n=1 Tax=Pyrobaculum aerophilum TaxID=13773 RepID=UPI000AC39803|nr:ABC transporter ATP-binding protein [Pyrobaculum aerophilum]
MDFSAQKFVEFDVYKTLGSFQLRAKGVFKEGVTCVVGPNGSGKTTLLKLLAAIYKPDSGYINYVGISSKVYVGDFYLPPESRGLDIVLAGRSRFGKRPVGKADVEMAVKYASLLGASDLLARRISSLSGGERQRLVIAAALSSEADLLLLDEPLSNLHGNWRGRVMEILRKYAEKKVVVITTHHGDVLKCCQEAFRMENGVLKQGGWVEEADCGP